MSKYILFGGPITRSIITEIVMMEGGIEYELRHIDITNDEHYSEEFLKINPAGLVPALITPEGHVLYETPAINLYLIDHHQIETLAPAVNDPQRGEFLSALFYITGELEPAMKRYFYPHRYALKDSDCDAMQQRALEHAMDRIKVINHRLISNGPFHLGERKSLADLTLAYWVVGSCQQYICSKFRGVDELVQAVLKTKFMQSFLII